MPSIPHEPSPEHDGFSSLITQEQAFLRALSRTMGVPPCDVPDVLQEANLYMVEHQQNFIPGTNFRAWAAQVLRYRILQYFRESNHRKRSHLSEEALEVLATEAAGHFDTVQPQLHRLNQCMKRLTPRQTELLEAVYSTGKNLKELAKESGQSHVALRKTISRIRILLKECIENRREE